MDKFAELLNELMNIIKEIQEHVPSATLETLPSREEGQFDSKPFFDAVRHTLFGGRLTQDQVRGMEAKIKAFEEASFPLSWASYALATSYHETATRMFPVREGLRATETWRKRNLRYYPYYGRGDVQLTWKENYERADRELGLGGALLRDLDLALDPDVSAKVMVQGMKEGWFSKGNSLPVHLPEDEGTLAQFRRARKIINLLDKADLIAGYALKFQTALKGAGYANPHTG